MNKEQESSESSEKTFWSEFKKGFKKGWNRALKELSDDPILFIFEPFLFVLQILLLFGVIGAVLGAIDYFIVDLNLPIKGLFLMFLGFFSAVILAIIILLKKIYTILKEIKDNKK